ncbi:MAG: alanine--glyoxylate aminotransferase family protein, partial [Spirochaetaceae bacterium]|nr:alanine--glyoxylate aminotransferase family protein [Spirochaetaceae bacterium]
VNLDETSTGQLYDINMISMFCKKNNIVLVVDAITSFLCDPFDMDKMGIDVAIVSSQKGLCMSPGLACIELTDKVIKERVNKINCKSLYFNFKDYLQNLERFQTPFTPAISLIYEMDDILNKILETGKKEWLQHIRENAEYFRKEVVKFDCCSIPEYPISYAITPVLFNKPIAKELKERLAADYDIYINPCGGEIADTMIRISHIGNLGIPDYKELLEDMKEVIKDLSL